MALITELVADHPYDEVVKILNERGSTGGWGKPFNVPSLTALCKSRDIPELFPTTASCTTRSSKAKVKAESWRANGSAATVGPWVGQSTRGPRR